MIARRAWWIALVGAWLLASTIARGQTAASGHAGGAPAASAVSSSAITIAQAPSELGQHSR